LEIEHIEKIPNVLKVDVGDIISLYIAGKLIHFEQIKNVKAISHWAKVKIGTSGIGYFVGDENLERDLRNHCK
jgi:hypothetical protein